MSPKEKAAYLILKFNEADCTGGWLSVATQGEDERRFDRAKAFALIAVEELIYLAGSTNSIPTIYFWEQVKEELLDMSCTQVFSSDNQN